MSDEKPGTDWAAKHAAAGSQARPVQDRPYAVDWSSTEPMTSSDPYREGDAR